MRSWPGKTFAFLSERRGALLLALICSLAFVPSYRSASAKPGRQRQPRLTLSTSSLNFGSVAVNSAATGSVTLTSSGNSAVTVNSASITGAGFSIVSGTVPVTLDPNQSVTLQLQFKPTASGSATGKLSISSNSSNGSTATVALSGTGTAATSPQLTLSTSTLSFGSVTVNSSSTQSLALTSSGTSPVTVNSASISGAAFSIVGATLPATLNPGQSMTLQLQFKPTAAGSATGSLTLSSNSTSNGTAVVSLSGTGTTSNPQLTVNSTTLSFGSVTVNSSTTQSVTLTSSGTSPVTVNSASTSGSGFTLVGGSFPITLNPNQTATLQVQFKPSAAGAVTGSLTISSNSTSNGTAVVSLSGTGTSAAHEVDLSWDAPGSSPDPVAGYHIYRSTGGGSSQLINPSVQTPTSYVDSTVVSGTSYNYMVKSVDSNGVESVPSNQVTVTVP
jgi:Abnormal spindle-like microcephaly-assoc'd, ASPM-SPD-2-Hydin